MAGWMHDFFSGFNWNLQLNASDFSISLIPVLLFGAWLLRMDAVPTH